MHDTQKPTCFIRAVRSEEELQFIEANEDHIRDIIKKRNPASEIIFLLLKDMRGLSDRCGFRWFRLGIANYIGYPYEMRTMFELSEPFAVFCARDILSEKEIKRNKKFDREHMAVSEKTEVFMNRLERGMCDIKPVLEAYWKNIEKGIYLWGAGRYGRIVLRHASANGIKIKGILDSDPDKIGASCENVPVIHHSKIADHCACILITVGSADSEKAIRGQLVRIMPDCRVLGISDLVAHPLILDWL